MTSVQNRLQQLSGNKFFLLFLMLMIVFQSCRTPREPRAPRPPAPETEKEKEPVDPEYPDIPDVIDALYPQEIKNEYTIAFLLPFFLSEEDRANPRNTTIANVAMEYYMGALVAIDTMRLCGANLNILAYDTRNDSITTMQQISRLRSQNVDLIIGPLMRKNIGPVYRYSAENRIPFLSPFFAPTDTANNPYFLLSIPRDEEFGRQASKFVNTKHAGEKILIVRQPTENEVRMAEGFKANLNPQLLTGVTERVFTQSSLADGFPEGFLAERNLIFVPSDEEIFVNAVITALRQSDKQVTLIGLNRWVDFGAMEGNAWADYNIHLLSSYHVDRTEPRVQRFREQYDQRFKEMPTEFAFRGFDDVLILLSRQQHTGKYIQRDLFRSNFDLLHSDYRFMPDLKTGGFANTFIHYLRLENNKLRSVHIDR